MSETVENVPEPLGGGALLRQAREKAGVHIAALAVALKVPVRQLEALEQGRLELLPDHTFARALASSVCRQLKVDPTPILAALPSGTPRTVTVGAGINEPFRTSTAPSGVTWRERLLRPPVLAAAVLLLAALALIILPELQVDEAAAPPAASTAPPAEPAAPAAPSSPASPAASPNVVMEPVTPNLVPSVPATTVPSASQPAAPAARQP